MSLLIGQKLPKHKPDWTEENVSGNPRQIVRFLENGNVAFDFEKLLSNHIFLIDWNFGVKTLNGKV